MPSIEDLVGPSGDKLIPEPRISVLKTPMATRVPPNLLTAIAQVTKTSVICIPMTADLLMGRVAREELISTHEGIHAVLQLPKEYLNADEKAAAVTALDFFISKMGPGDGIYQQTRDRLTKEVKQGESK